MLKLKKILRKADPERKIWVRDDRLKVAENWLFWNENKELRCGDVKGEEILNELYGEKMNGLNLSYDQISKN